MIRQTAFTLFLVCLFICAGLVLSFIWNEPSEEFWFQIAASLFIVGLAAFLVWFGLTLRELHAKFVT